MDWRIPWGRKESDTRLSDLHFRELRSHASCDMAKIFFKKSWDWKEVLEILLYGKAPGSVHQLQITQTCMDSQDVLCYFDLVYSFDS